MSMTGEELDQVLTLRWPAVVRRVMAEDVEPWIKGFVRSIAKHGKRPDWTPSPKQEALMRRLLAEHSDPDSGRCELFE